MAEKKTNEQFIDGCNLIHNFKYDYSKVIYDGAHKNITVICPIHGEFETLANNHQRGHGCIKCGTIATTKIRRFSKEDAISRAKEIWGDTFDYSDMEYTKMFDKHRIKCNRCGNYFNQALIQHINGKHDGCPNCRIGPGWTRSNWVEFCNHKKRSEPQVYIIRLFDEVESFIKIGITSRTIRERQHEIPYEYEVVRTYLGSPLFVYDKEIELHRKFKNYPYTPLKRFGGDFECFSMDILPLIDQIQ